METYSQLSLPKQIQVGYIVLNIHFEKHGCQHVIKTVPLSRMWWSLLAYIKLIR